MNVNKLEFMIRAVEDINEELSAVKQKLTVLKPQFEQLISDQTIALDDRWNLFVQAPVYIKNQNPWIVDIKIAGKEILWYDDFYVDRYVVVNMENTIESMTLYPEKWTNEHINEMKEFILSKNLHSFTNDW